MDENINDARVLRESAKDLMNHNLPLALKTIKIAHSLDPNDERTLNLTTVLNRRFHKKRGDLLLRIKKLLFKTQINDNYDKTIWFFWAQGYEQAPDVVKIAYKSWLSVNPDYNVVFLDNNKLMELLKFNLDEFIYLNENISLPYAGRSDFLRSILLYKYGGVWVDSTTFCLKPLSHWLDLSHSDFFIFRQNNDCQDRSMVSWFMASKKGSILSKQLVNSAYKFLTENKKNYLTVVSNARIPLPEKKLLSRDGTGFEYLNHCESYGYVPYFWFFYLWNEIKKNNQEICNALDSKTNNYSTTDGYDERYLNSFVAKNTYKEKAMNQETLKNRIKHIKTLL